MRTVLGDDADRRPARARCSRRPCPARRASTTATRSACRAGNDPDCRRAFPWDEARWDDGLRAFVRGLLQLRAAEPALRADAVVVVGAAGGAIAYERRLDGASASSWPSTRAMNRSGSTSRSPAWPTARASSRSTCRVPTAIASRSASASRRRHRDSRPRCAEWVGPAPELRPPVYSARQWLTFPIELDAALAERLARALDVEGKIPRALETLGPVAGRDVLLVDGVADGIRATPARRTLGARVVVGSLAGRRPDASVDVVVSCWSAFRGPDPAEVDEAASVLRPGGRLLVLHDYGRDDVSRLRGDLPEYGLWSRRDGPFLRGGFKVRVVHCFWTFDSIEDGQAFLGEAFGETGRQVGAEMARPRLSYNVAVYHRTFG